MTTAFEEAVERVLADFALNAGGEGSDGADMVAVGVLRSDCLALLSRLIEGEPMPPSPAFLSILVQWSVATGVQLERARWQT
jgi:hypothetical protein